jgi:hypothetical protein
MKGVRTEGHEQKIKRSEGSQKFGSSVVLFDVPIFCSIPPDLEALF